MYFATWRCLSVVNDLILITLIFPFWKPEKKKVDYDTEYIWV